MRARARKMPGACGDSGSGAFGRVALASLAVAAVMAGPEVALATSDTTFGEVPSTEGVSRRCGGSDDSGRSC